MDDNSLSALSSLKVGTGWIDIEVLSEPDVVLTLKGYAPVLRVKILKSGITKLLYISAKSLATKLEMLREGNNNKFSGLKLRICKESQEKTSKYLMEPLTNE